ncbi:hypothetical protein L7F22_023752 [Adiantum nelumboides]|nr:hypothetical protein [Adiantum nelumboides]
MDHNLRGIIAEHTSSGRAIEATFLAPNTPFTEVSQVTYFTYVMMVDDMAEQHPHKKLHLGVLDHIKIDLKLFLKRKAMTRTRPFISGYGKRQEYFTRKSDMRKIPQRTSSPTSYQSTIHHISQVEPNSDFTIATVQEKEPEKRALVNKYEHLMHRNGLPSQLPPSQPEDQHIDLESGATPPSQFCYRLSKALEGELETQLADLRAGFIYSSCSPYATPVLLIMEKDK